MYCVMRASVPSLHNVYRRYDVPTASPAPLACKVASHERRVSSTHMYYSSSLLPFLFPHLQSCVHVYSRDSGSG